MSKKNPTIKEVLETKMIRNWTDWNFHWMPQRLASRLVVTNGCFDIIHSGHVEFLAEARRLGDALVVGLNGDESVEKLKGKGRPINSAEDRAKVLAGFFFVNFIYIFEEERATEFLKLAKPEVYTKAGDYTLESLVWEEKQVLESEGTEIVFLPFVDGKSTTKTLELLNNESK